MTSHECYLQMPWTSDTDKCEHCDEVVMSDDSYVEGRLGHYCSDVCHIDAETGGADDYTGEDERRQLGLTAC